MLLLLLYNKTIRSRERDESVDVGIRYYIYLDVYSERWNEAKKGEFSIIHRIMCFDPR